MAYYLCYKFATIVKPGRRPYKKNNKLHGIGAIQLAQCFADVNHFHCSPNSYPIRYASLPPIPEYTKISNGA